MVKCPFLFSIAFSYCFFNYIHLCLALDSNNVQDACPTETKASQAIFINGFPCKNPLDITASDFKSTSLRHAGNTDNYLHSSTTIVTAVEFAGLNTLSLSVSRTDLDQDGLVLPHSHPRASEMVFVNSGVVLAGFIDSNNVQFQMDLKKGDVFVFPKGLLHYCLNAGSEPATVLSVFNSQNPGVVSNSGGMFDSDTDQSEAIKKMKKRLISVSSPEVDGQCHSFQDFGI